ncbi:DUF3318 domain-containing protein [Cupriavidus necator]|uniref:DUF3318 domain-containing protein n=1 Tax=Cupriavidus necator (strain ATCC 17699 / DSM 428 / KCTC 22496 / NCIMB 10442 / H16 / Stanier 337) TaxID=381666 RepID=Q0K7X1_CUPNH|nr:DUF3318 domain-containing protein [Cupriavidus necator]QCC01675.1 DUF3318 domain-containing protein [Cupriavidus necator H16]QQB75494.1 DUF3318 domain-containing protein [Cupriavidus necator]WKA40069.1 DUF3318 domain-containing protein [Cupriavidus necator]CAJ93900.1 Hypothetical protein H16_A2822 [Cupriavidus necator H16]
MSPLEPDHSAAGHDRRNHPRRARFTQEVRLPLAVRKELLLTRAALERYDCLQALHEVRGGAHRLGTIGHWLPRIARPGSWMKVVGMTKDYPLLSTVLTLALPLVKRTPVLRWTWKLSKVGLAAGAAYWVYNTWREARHQAVPPATAPTPAPAGTPPGADTGFRDPLVP